MKSGRHTPCNFCEKDFAQAQGFLEFLIYPKHQHQSINQSDIFKSMLRDVALSTLKVYVQLMKCRLRGVWFLTISHEIFEV